MWRRPSRRARCCSIRTTAIPPAPPLWRLSAKTFRRSRPVSCARRPARSTTRSSPNVGAGRFDVDVMQLSDVSHGFRLPEEGRLRALRVAGMRRLQEDTLSSPNGYFFWTGVDFAGIAYNTDKVTAADAPKRWKDFLKPRWSNVSAAKFRPAACSSCSGTNCASSTATASGRSSRSCSRTPSNSRAQLFDRLAKGDDMITARRISRLSSGKIAGRRSIRRAAGWPGRDAAGRRRGQQAAASGSVQAVRRLGDVEARPGLVPDQSELSTTARCAPTRRRCRPA